LGEFFSGELPFKNPRNCIAQNSQQFSDLGQSARARKSKGRTFKTSSFTKGARAAGERTRDLLIFVYFFRITTPLSHSGFPFKHTKKKERKLSCKQHYCNEYIRP
jgi:hypothetical protein